MNRSQNPPKRHVRKNPLIVPSAMVSNLLRNEKQESNPVYKPMTTYQADAFDSAIEQNIDALDSIGDEGGEEALFNDNVQGKIRTIKLTRLTRLTKLMRSTK